MTTAHVDELKAKSHLGKKTSYANSYDPTLLFAIPRQIKRDELHIGSELPFAGVDIWNAYEVSWLNKQGKPVVAIAEISVPCESPNLFESKSIKLYLNSFNGSKFRDLNEVERTIAYDLSNVTGVSVNVTLHMLQSYKIKLLNSLPGTNIDHLDIETNCYENNPDFLTTTNEIVEEELNSDLLKSNCLVTNQPDWGSVYIHYRGKQMNHEGLLKYIVSMRNHNEFHEQCVERIFVDIMQRCQPEELTVYARYARRGGLDINPYRTTNKNYTASNDRLIRQ